MLQGARTPCPVQRPRGKPRSSEYGAYLSMKQRCLNPNANQYYDYGGRGILVCTRWLKSYANFLADVGRRPAEGYSLDRIDNDGDYTPDNCRWATRHEQELNKRKRTPAYIVDSLKAKLAAYEERFGPLE